MISVIIFTAGHDTGGQGYRLKRAFDRYYPDEFSVRSVHSAVSYFKYPSDIEYRSRDAAAIFGKADVLHMRNGLEGLKRLRPEALEGKVGLISHYHGTRFREEHEALSAKDREVGAIQLVSTVDLLDLEPNLVWLPSPIDVFELKNVRDSALIDLEAPIRVCHAPTNRKVKSTQAVLDAILRLNCTIGLPIELDLVEKQPFERVLQRKACSDIYVDQLNLGYGNNALEAWAMGLPVVAGVKSVRVRALMGEIFGQIPFYEADEGNLAEKLAELATDVHLRLQWGHIGYDHTMRFHDEKKVADQLASLYRAALEQRRG
jgi:glycosyltransferase involved in cell wall biosynthesis